MSYTPLELISNGDSGFDARIKINAAITVLNGIAAQRDAGSFRGASTWTPVMTNVTQSLTNSNTFTKGSGGETFNGQVYSEQGYSRGAFVTAKVGATNTDIMIGLTATPTSSLGFDAIDFAMYASSTGEAIIYESGSSIITAGNYTTDTIFYITYDGADVRYYNDDTLVRTVARPISTPLYLDTSIYTPDAAITNLTFGPMGEAG